jgi:hypothetical protein
MLTHFRDTTWRATSYRRETRVLSHQASAVSGQQESVSSRLLFAFFMVAFACRPVHNLAEM